MKLTASPRDMLVIRMKAYAYENVRQGAMHTVERLADQTLANFQSMIESNPVDSQGFWAGFYFEEFKQACEG